MPGETARAVDAAKADAIDTPSLAYQRMSKKWPKLDALLGGTDAMRDQAPTTLPKFEAESVEDWRTRTKMSFLFNAFRDTLERIVSAPFAKRLEVIGELDPRLARIAVDADMHGTSLHNFSKGALQEAVLRGYDGIFVDFPRAARDIDAESEAAADLHPYFVLVTAKSNLGVDVDTFPTGRARPVRIRIKWTQTVRTGEYAQGTRDYIREFTSPTIASGGTPEELNLRVRGLIDFLAGRLSFDDFVALGGIPGAWSIWELRPDEDDWVRVQGPHPHTFPGVPFVPFYTNQVGPYEGESAIEGVADLNHQYWQVSSDLGQLVHASCVPVPTGSGVELKTLEDGLPRSSRSAWLSTNPQARFDWAEVKGTALQQVREYRSEIRAEMEALGHQPFLRRGGVQPGTATEKMVDEGRSISDMQAWVTDLEAAIKEAYRFGALWLSSKRAGEVTLPADFQVRIHKDFAPPFLGQPGAGTVFQAVDKRMLDRRNGILELKRRRELSEHLDPDQILDAIDDDPPPELPGFAAPFAGGRAAS